MNWTEVLSINLLDGSLISIKAGPALIIGILLFLIFAFFVKRRWKSWLNNWEVEEANVKLGGLGDVKIKPDYDDMQIAHKAWIELSTRKAGIPFDEEHDVIVEVYDSWYRLFGEMRDLVKQISSAKIRRSEDTQELVRLLTEALNNGLRPHLTKWQARFRGWYLHQKEKHPDKSPQEIQKLYPQYSDLVKELKDVNKQMVDYTGFIKKIAHGEVK